MIRCTHCHGKIRWSNSRQAWFTKSRHGLAITRDCPDSVTGNHAPEDPVEAGPVRA